MTAYLSPVFDTQFFDGSTVAAGYKLYTYDSGTTTHKAVYTDQAGTTPHTYVNDGAGGLYIALDAAGRVTGQMFLGSGEYTFVLKTVGGSTVKTWSDVAGATTTVDDAAIRSDLASTSDAARGDAIVGVKRIDLTNAPALTLHKWIERGVANVRRCALPSNFNFAADDAQPYIQNLISDVESLGIGYKIELDGGDLWRIGSTITLNSDKNTGIVVRDMPRLKYVGSAMDGVSDDGSHAMIYFSGTDHAFGGIDGDGVLQIDADSKANHIVYWAGSWNAGFKMRRIHGKGALLDILRHVNSGTSGPVLGIIDDCSFFPATGYTFSATQAVCGRYPIHITLNSSTGMVSVRNVSSDSGVNGCLGIDATSFAGADVFITDSRFECYKTNTDVITLDYGSASSAGRLNVQNVKTAAAGSGTIRSLIRNSSASGLRPIINIEPYASNDAMSDIYTHVADTNKSVTYDAKRLGCSLQINAVANTTIVPVSSSLPATPVDGELAYDSTNEQLIIGKSGATRRMRAGRSLLLGPAASPVTGADTDTQKLCHNNNLASFTYNLPSIAAVGTGWLSPIFCTRQIGVITLAPNGTDSIDTKSASASYASSNAAGNMVQLMAGPGSTWVVVSIKGTWS